MNDDRFLSEAGIALQKWFSKNGRDLPWRHTRDPYRIWLSEIMLQQTRVETVINYYEKFLKEFPTVEKLAEADLDTVFKLWEGLGYYRRAEHLLKGAQYIVEKYHGHFPDSVDELISIPGVGSYTAGAIAAIAFGKHEAAVDGNVLRVTARVTGSRDPVGSSGLAKTAEKATLIMMPVNGAWAHTQAMMDLGANICLPLRPHCGICPLQNYCRAYEGGFENELPEKKKRKGKRVVARKIYMLCWRGSILMRRRPSTGLLRNMWEFPADEVDNNFLNPFSVSNIQPVLTSSHIFSHVIWNMVGYWIVVEEKVTPEDCQWMSHEQLLEIPLPSAMTPFRDYSLQQLAHMEEV